MSLFKTKELWSWQNSQQNSETYSTNSLAFFPSSDLIANSPYTDLVFTASLEGLLRLFHVVPIAPDDKSESTSKASNLLLEVDLCIPILQIEVGNLASGSKGPQVAILHPRQLAVYSISRAVGNHVKETKNLESYQLNLVYQHKLSRSAFSMCIGPFGGVQGKDFVCVQSIDGTLNLFENESFNFSRFLPGFLLPGPMAYVAKTDSFVTVSSSLQLESYKYQTLATATEEKSREKDDKIMSGKKIVADWVLGLGENATQIKVIQNGSSKDAHCKIIVLGVRNLFVLYHSGVLAFSKKLDYAPVTMFTYPSIINDEKLVILIATETQTLLIYEMASLKWAAQVPFTPLIVKRGSFSQNGDEVIRNAIVLMSKSGDLYVGALGTDPALFSAPRPEARPVNYEETDAELAALNTIIKTAQSSDGAVPPEIKDELTVNVEMSPHLEHCHHPTGVSDEDGLPMVRIIISLSSSTPLTKIRVGIDVCEPMVATKSSFIVQTLTDTFKTEVSCYLSYAVIPHNMDFTVTAAYISGQGMPIVITNVTTLPMRLIVKPCAPIKEADYKVTVSTNKHAVSLLDLFPEFVLDGTMANAAGFQYFGGPYVTVLSSKTSQRYRLQSDNLPCLWLLTQTLESRLAKKFANDKAPLECSYSSSLPLHEYYTEIEQHFSKRKKMANLDEQLAQRAAQFRSIQKRLLSRFKDKTPTPLTNLDSLLEGTYRQLQQHTEAVEQCLLEVKRSSSNLACITNLLVLLTRLSTGMDQAEAAKVRAALTPVVHDYRYQGWEETTDAALTFLLRTSLAKAGKENQGATPITLEAAKDISRIKKHISSVVDRITKGSRIEDERNKLEAPSPLEFSVDLDEENGGGKRDRSNGSGEETTPIGSHFGEAGERLRSARSRDRTGLSSAAPKPKENGEIPELTEEEKEAENEIIEDNEEEEEDKNADDDNDEIW